MKPEETEKLLNQPMQEDMPGLAQHYCVCCARYFVSPAAIKEHFKTKEHKKRFKVVTTEKPYSHEEAEKAAGL